MFRRTRNRRNKDASPAGPPPPPPPPAGEASQCTRTRMSDRVFRDRRASADMETRRSFFSRKMHKSPRTSDEQAEADDSDIPAHPAIRQTRRPMEPRDPGYEDFTGLTHSRQKSADLDQIRKSLSTRHEALRIHEDPYSYSSKDADEPPVSAPGHRRQAQSLSGYQQTPSQKREEDRHGALSYEAAAAAAAALRPRRDQDSGGSASSRAPREDASAQPAPPGSMRLPMKSGKGRVVMISARSPGSELVEKPWSDDSTAEEPDSADSKPPSTGVKRAPPTGENSKTPEKAEHEPARALHGSRSAVPRPGEQGMTERSLGMPSAGASSSAVQEDPATRQTTSKQSSQAEKLAQEDSETLSLSEPIDAASGDKLTVSASQSQRSALASNDTEVPIVAVDSPSPEETVRRVSEPSNRHPSVIPLKESHTQEATEVTGALPKGTSADTAGPHDPQPQSIPRPGPAEDPNTADSSAMPDKITRDALPEDGYKLALENQAGPSGVQVPRSTPASATGLSVDDLASSLGAVTIKHHPELAVDYTRHEREPVVHEEKRTHVHTIYEPQRTRSFHFHERRDIIQPIIDPEPTVLPAQHWMEDPETGKIFKIPDELGRQLMEGDDLNISESST